MHTVDADQQNVFDLVVVLGGGDANRTGRCEGEYSKCFFHFAWLTSSDDGMERRVTGMLRRVELFVKNYRGRRSKSREQRAIYSL